MIIQVYSDETYCNASSFQIIASLFGSPKESQNYQNEVEALIQQHPLVGNEFKGFHSNKLNENNWSTLGKVYLDLIDIFKNFVNSHKLRRA